MHFLNMLCTTNDSIGRAQLPPSHSELCYTSHFPVLYFRQVGPQEHLFSH